MRALLPILILGSVLGITPNQAHAFELSVEEERNVQVASLATGYGFSILHTFILAIETRNGQPLDRSWVPSTIMAGISTGAMAGGYVILAGEVADVDNKAAYALAAPPGFILSGAQLGMAIHGAQYGDGDLWMDTPEALVTLVHGLSLATLGTVLIAGANPGSSDLSKIPPIYTWAAGGALLSGYATLSLALD